MLMDLNPSSSSDSEDDAEGAAEQQVAEGAVEQQVETVAEHGAEKDATAEEQQQDEQNEQEEQQLKEQHEEEEEEKLRKQLKDLDSMGFADAAQNKRVLSVAVGTHEDEVFSGAVSLLMGEMASDLSKEPTAQELAAAKKDGPAIGSRIQKAFEDDEGGRRNWQSATVTRYCAEVGHLLVFDDGCEERVDFHGLQKGKEWRAIPSGKAAAAASSSQRQRPRQAQQRDQPHKRPRLRAAEAAEAREAAKAMADAAKAAEKEADEHRLTALPAKAQPLLDEPDWRSGTSPSVRLKSSEDLGWAQLSGLNVDPVQQWLASEITQQMKTPDAGKRTTRGRAEQRARVHFIDWGSDNSLDPRNSRDQQKKDRGLLLNLSEYPRTLQSFFDRFFTTSVAEGGFGAAAAYPPVPPCILELDRQLHEELPELLGKYDDGDFTLAYAQVTRMCTGNEIEWHLDSPHFGDVIITVGLAGNADVRLRRAAHSKLGGGWQGKTERTRAPDVPLWLEVSRVGVGDAYSLAGCCRHRYEHKILSDPTDAHSPEFGAGVSRVAVTLRYFRRSFCQVETRRLLTGAQPSLSQQRPLTAAEELARNVPAAPSQQFCVVDVKATHNRERNPFTYPGVVLGSAMRRPDLPDGGSSTAEPVERMLYVQYLCDRRTPAMPAEAVLETEWVSADSGVLSNETTVRRCHEEHPDALLLSSADGRL